MKVWETDCYFSVSSVSLQLLCETWKCLRLLLLKSKKALKLQEKCKNSNSSLQISNATGAQISHVTGAQGCYRNTLISFLQEHSAAFPAAHPTPPGNVPELRNMLGWSFVWKTLQKCCLMSCFWHISDSHIRFCSVPQFSLGCRDLLAMQGWALLRAAAGSLKEGSREQAHGSGHTGVGTQEWANGSGQTGVGTQDRGTAVRAGKVVDFLLLGDF